MTDDRPGYEALVQAAIQREKDVLGPDEAVERAHTVDGLVVDEEGQVERIDADGKQVLGALIDVYVEASGDVAAFLIARRIENMPQEDLDLPSNLSKHL